MSNPAKSKPKRNADSRDQTQSEESRSSQPHGNERDFPPVYFLAKLATSVIAPSPRTPKEAVELAMAVWWECTDAMERRSLIKSLEKEDRLTAEQFDGKDLSGKTFLLEKIGGKTIRDRKRLFINFAEWLSDRLFTLEGNPMEPELEKELIELIPISNQQLKPTSFEHFAKSELTPYEYKRLAKQAEEWRKTLPRQKGRAGYLAMNKSRKKA